MKAREVLGDCKIALQMLEDETDLQKWRIIWVASLALIRSVGHVLDKVDGQDNEINKISRSLYKQWTSDNPEHLIFRNFIEQERNNVLKEYSLNLNPLETIQIVVQSTHRSNLTGEIFTNEGIYDLDENIYRPMMEGDWQGIDARDVMQDAVSWWESQLSEIDKSLKPE